MKTAFITGSAGFVGRHFHEQLISHHWEVTRCDINDSSIPTDAMDLFDPNQHSKQYDLVIHAAAVGPNRLDIDRFPEHFPHNVMLDAALFDWAWRTAQPRVLYFSSSAVYSNVLTFRVNTPFVESSGTWNVPFDTYGETKRIGERMAEEINDRGGTRVTVVRPFTGYGADQGGKFPFGAFLARATRRMDPFTIWGSGLQVRDWIHVLDVVRGSLALVEAGVKEPTNLCTGIGTSMWDVATLFTEATGYSPVFATDLARPNGVDYRVGDATKLQKTYTPAISIEEGVDRAVRGYI